MQSETKSLLAESEDEVAELGGMPAAPARLTRQDSEQEPSWLTDAASTLDADSSAADEAAAEAAARLDELLVANEKLSADREQAALAALAAAEAHALDVERARAGVAEAQSRTRSAQATTTWARVGSGASRAAAAAEVERARAALAVQAVQSQAATMWARAGRAAAKDETERAQAALEAAEARLGQMKKSRAEGASEAIAAVALAKREAVAIDVGGPGGGGGGDGGATAPFFDALGVIGEGVSRLGRLSMDEWADGLLALSRGSLAQAGFRLGAFASHAYACGRATQSGCEVCTCEPVSRELRHRGRGFVLSLPVAAAHALLGLAALLLWALLFLAVFVKVVAARRLGRAAPKWAKMPF